MSPPHDIDQADQGDQLLARPLESQQHQVSAEQWRDISALKPPDAGRITAEHTLSELFGAPTIVGIDGKTYLQGHVANDIQVSKGVQNLDDLRALGTGIGQGLLHVVQETVNYLATPEAVDKTLLQMGPALDNAVNYYANTPFDEILQDAQQALGCAGQVLEDTLGHPLTPEQRGEHAGIAMTAFLPIGANRALNEKELEALGGIQRLEGMTEAELEALGVRRFEVPRLKLERDEFSIKASIAGDDMAFVRAEQPAPGVVDITSINRGSLPKGVAGEFLAEALRAHGAVPTKELVFSNITNEPTRSAFKLGADPAQSVLGQVGTKALESLGLKARAYRFELVKGKLNLVIEVE